MGYTSLLPLPHPNSSAAFSILKLVDLHPHSILTTSAFAKNHTRDCASRTSQHLHELMFHGIVCALIRFFRMIRHCVCANVAQGGLGSHTGAMQERFLCCTTHHHIVCFIFLFFSFSPFSFPFPFSFSFSFLLSPFSFLLSPFSFLLSPFSFLLSPFSFLLSPFSFLLSLSLCLSVSLSLCLSVSLSLCLSVSLSLCLSVSLSFSLGQLFT